LPKTVKTDNEKAIEDLEGLLAQLDITDVDAAKALGCHHTSLFRWLTGRTPVPVMVLRFFELMLMLRTHHKTMEAWWIDEEAQS
jgi:hypothetical protein